MEGGIQFWFAVGYIFFSTVMGFGLIPIAKTKTERILTLIVSGPVIWCLFSFYLVKSVAKGFRSQE